MRGECSALLKLNSVINGFEWASLIVPFFWRWNSLMPYVWSRFHFDIVFSSKKYKTHYQSKVWKNPNEFNVVFFFIFMTKDIAIFSLKASYVFLKKKKHK